MKIYDTGHQLTRAELIELEKLAEESLPDDYEAFLLKHNGGCPETDAFYYLRNVKNELGSVATFYSLTKSRTEFSCLYSFWKRSIHDESVSARFFPIANDGIGNRIYLSMSGNDKGYVYYWIHDLLEGEPNFFMVAKTFSEFLSMLFEYRDDN